MRSIPIILNATVAVLSITFFLYTFVAVNHLEGIAREFVTEKTLGYSGTVVVAVEKSLESPLTKKLLSASHEESIRSEIGSYREDPVTFIRNLTGADREPEKPKRFLPARSGIDSFKGKVRDYYDGTLAALIADLRIFSGSNAVAAILALLLVLRSRGETRKIFLWFSLLLVLAVLYSSCLYVDGMSFFTILFRFHMGWWYPVCLAIMVAKLFMDYGRKPFGSESPADRDGH